jgi:diguanylate cyclase (GGDEF)-like protein
MKINALVVGLFLLVSALIIVGWLVSLYLVAADQDFWPLIRQQAWWFLPALALSMGVVYRIIDRAILTPLSTLTDAMGRVVQAQHPGYRDAQEPLQAGLGKLHRYIDGLTELATHDPLTRLHNRIIFEEKLKQALLDGKRTGKKFALVFLDIDGFYRVNQEYGSYIADALLRQLAIRLLDNLRESDTLARLEKDNFALLLEFSDTDQLTGLLEKLREQLVNTYRIYGREVKVAISIGAAVYPDHGNTMVDLALRADDALIKAQNGDWPLVMAHSAPGTGGISAIQALRKGIEKNEFSLVYQPVVRLSSHRTQYFEALLRWTRPELHDYSIAQIIQMAENSQLIKPLTNWILDSACRQLAALGRADVKVAINLSMVDLHDETLPERIEGMLRQHSVAAAALQIEITEGQIMQEPERVVDILTRLNRMGLPLTIDDFGTGQASLTYLRRLPVGKLKIDQSFIKDMVSNAEDRAIVEATIKLAHTLDIEVVAEGVETAAVYDLLHDMGCDYVQGYYVSRPLDHDQIIHWCDHSEPRSAS